MNLENFKKVIKANCGIDGPKHTLYALGPSGSGKSSAVKQAFIEMEMDFYADLRLGMIDRVELGGIQIPVAKDRMTINTLPSYFPKDPNAFGIIHLDEFDHGDQPTQSAAYQLVLDKCIGEFKLPPNVSVIMSSNRKKDGGLHFTVPKPTKNRVIQINTETDLGEFINYAKKEKINPVIISFLRSNPEFLYHNGNVAAGDGFNELGAFASPRSWFTMDDVIQFDLEENIIEELAVGTVGPGPTDAFLQYIEEAGSSISVDDILNGDLSNLNIDDTLNMRSMYYNLDIMEQTLSDSPSSLKKTQENILEFINIIKDLSLRAVWWKTLNDLSPRMFKPKVTEKSAEKLRLEILQSIKDIL